MTRKTTLLFILLVCALNYSYSQTTFDWDNPTPIDNGDNVTQTKDAIITTFIGDAGTDINDKTTTYLRVMRITFIQQNDFYNDY